MEFKKIGNFYLTRSPIVEYVNPIEHYFEMQLDISINSMQLMVESYLYKPDIDENLARKTAHQLAVKNHLKNWKADYKKIMSVEYPENYFDFLLSSKRKQQNKILESFPLTIDSLQGIFYKAWFDYEFTFSSYHFEKEAKPFPEKHHPELFYMQPDGTFEVVGNTNLSTGQMKAIINQRNNVAAKFIDNGRRWHCFLHTWDGIRGKEIGKMPHIHYISSAFGYKITREYVLEQLSKGKYDLPSMIHIPFEKKLFEVSPL